MRVAFIVAKFPALSETFILNQIVGLIERGHEVDIYAEYRGDTSKIHPAVEKYRMLERTYYSAVPRNLLLRLLKGIGVLLSNGYKDPLRFLEALNFLKYGKEAILLKLLYTAAIPSCRKLYDIIHCQFGTQSCRGMFFQTLNTPHPKLITSFRGHDISSFVQKKGERVYDQLFKTGDFFLANCEFFKRRAIALGCDEKKILVHRSAIDCSKFVFNVRQFPPDGPIRIASTGRLVEKKGLEYCIRAVAKQAKIDHSIEYNIIGDGPLRKYLEQLIEELKVNNIVNLLGWKNQPEIIEILKDSHIFIAPSVTAKDGDRDAPTNVLKEAMSMGLPVIGTYHGGIPELIEDGVSGFLVPERDADAIAQKLSYLIEHPEIWPVMGKVGHEHVKAHYDLNKLNDELVEIYDQLLTTKLETDRQRLQNPPAIPTYGY